MRDTAAGDISDLIPIENIRDDLKLIRNELNSEIESFPINLDKDNVHNIFAFTHIRAGEKSDRLLIELTIPTVERITFTLYQLTPIPFISQNTLHMLEVGQKSVLADSEMTQFVEFENGEKCLGNDVVGKICHSCAPILSNNAKNCSVALLTSNNLMISENYETKMIPFSNYVIQIGNANRYFVFVTESTTIRETSPNIPVKTFEIFASQILTIQPKCSISLLNFKLKSHITEKWQAKSEIIANLD